MLSDGETGFILYSVQSDRRARPSDGTWRRLSDNEMKTKTSRNYYRVINAVK